MSISLYHKDDFAESEKTEPTRRGKFTRFIAQEWVYILMVVFVGLLILVYLIIPVSKTPPKPTGPVLELTLKESILGGSTLVGIFILILLIVSLVWLIKYIIKRFKGKDPLPKEERMPVKWNLWDIVKIAAFFFLMIFLSLSILKMFRALLPVTKDFQKGIMDPIGTICSILPVLFGIYLVKEVRKAPIASLGLKRTDLSKNILRGIVAYVTFFSILVITGIISWIISELTGIPNEGGTDIGEVLYPQWGILRVIIGVISLAIIGPIAEEILFRGFFLGALRKWFSPWAAIIICSLLFAVLHEPFIGFPVFFAIGLLLAYLYERTQSLIPSITVHIIHNSLVTIVWFTLIS